MNAFSIVAETPEQFDNIVRENVQELRKMVNRDLIGEKEDCFHDLIVYLLDKGSKGYDYKHTMAAFILGKTKWLKCKKLRKHSNELPDVFTPTKNLSKLDTSYVMRKLKQEDYDTQFIIRERFVNKRKLRQIANNLGVTSSRVKFLENRFLKSVKEID